MVRAYEIILKKRNGLALTGAEIDYLVKGYAAGLVPDYQMAAFAMAVYFQGMSREETLALTMAMVQSGETVSLADIPGIKVDKHSTGGVGDTTTLVLVPLVAAAGVPVAKMSGRGLGHTGGTLDKLESIPGFRTDLSREELADQVRRIGAAVAGQTANLVPADKALYALRDVTATVDSLPLIASSIMSKKLAAGADAIVLDVKCGDGAFMKNLDDALALARAMVEIGRGAGRETVAILSAMEQPLGRAVGNALEVEEAIKTLRGEGPADLEELCLVLGGQMLCLAGKVPDPARGSELLKGLLGGAALNKFKELIAAQHGDARVADDPSLLPQAPVRLELPSPAAGFVQRIRAESIGRSAMLLGAGRETKEDAIDPAAGIVLLKKAGDAVKAGEPLAVLHTALDPASPRVEQARRMALEAYEIDAAPPAASSLILGAVGA